MTLKIGLTGGIACGKTVVSNFFAELGVPVLDTDIISREVTAPGAALLAPLAARFGQEILQPDGSLNRRALRLKVFGNAQALADLNALVHPAILNKLAADFARVHAPYALLVIPLLFEQKLESLIDRILVCDAPEELQLQRLIKRDHLSPDTARAMIKSQTSREYRRSRADDLIEADGRPMSEIRSAVINLHHNYLKIADSSKA